MSTKLTAFIKILVVSAASSVFALQPLTPTKAEINAQPTNETKASREIILAQNQNDYQFPFLLSVPEALQRVFFFDSGTTIDNWKFIRQIDLILGISNFPQGSYPELEIFRDAELVDIFYRDVLAQQTISDPVIRTRDLPNPFTDSLFGHPECLRFGPTICGEATPVGKPISGK